MALLSPPALQGAPRSPAQDSARDAARVERLLAAMTLDEKIAVIHGATEAASSYQGQAGYLPGVARLGIPSLRLADGPPGVLFSGVSPPPAPAVRLAMHCMDDWLSRQLARLQSA